MGAECQRAAKAQEFFVCQFRRSSRFPDVEVPDWAQVIADEIAPGSRVRVGRLGSAQLVESVLVARDQANDEDEAASIAERIAERVDP